MKAIIDDETKYLIKAGFMKKIDIVFFLAIVLNIALAAAQSWMAWGVTLPVLLTVGVLLFTGLMWLVVLAFRVIYFLFEVKNDISNITEASARRAVQFFNNLAKD